MSLDPQTEYAIRLYALFGSPAAVFKDMQAEFGAGCMSASAVKKIREKYRSQILTKRKELSAKIPLMDIEERWAYLQQIVDGALEGDTIFTPSGNSYQKVDRPTALSALKLASEIASVQGVVNTEDDELIRSIVTEAYEEIKKAEPAKPDAEILKEIVESLGEKTRPYITELVSVSANG